MSATIVTVDGGKCQQCGVSLRAINWHGDVRDRRYFPVEVEREELHTDLYHDDCGGRVLLTLKEQGER